MSLAYKKPTTYKKNTHTKKKTNKHKAYTQYITNLLFYNKKTKTKPNYLLIKC